MVATVAMSSAEESLAVQLTALGIPFEREFAFAKEMGRRWRFDLAMPDRKFAIEVEGGIWTKGRHVTGAGYTKDIEKYEAALLLGWIVYRCTSAMALSGHAARTIQRYLET